MESFPFDLVFHMRKVLTALVLPPNGPLIVAFAGLLLLRRWPQFGREHGGSGAKR